MLCFSGRECLCKHIGELLVSGAVDESGRALFDDVADEMKANINMLGAGMVLMVFCELNSRLVVQKKSGGRDVDIKDLVNKGSEPDGFLRSMGYGNVFRFGGGQGNNFLSFSTPGNSTAMLPSASVYPVKSDLLTPYVSHKSIVLLR